MSKRYNLTDTQVRHLAIICYREQGGNLDGVKACASHMCNYYEKYQSKNFRDVYECTFGSGWYWGKERNDEWVREHPSVPADVVNAVRDVIVNGNRTLPDYVDEYDCLTDIALIINDGVVHTREREKSYVLNRKNYKPHKTIIQNIYAEGASDRYTFYCFPDGVDGHCDAFGYLYKPKTIEEEPVLESIPADPVENAVSWMEMIAANDSHGYSQANRWGPDYDCSSSVISAYEQAGIPVKSRGATYTGNLRSVFLQCGFKDVTDSCDLDTGAGMKRGDVLLYHISGTNGHTAMYAGNGMIVHARGQSYGSPQTGDQGSEIAVTPYSRSKWQYVLRYGSGIVSPAASTASTASRKTVRYGSKGSDVLLLQKILNKKSYRGYNGRPLNEDGEFGTNTLTAVRAFQRDNGLEVDGIVGKMTWSALTR